MVLVDSTFDDALGVERILRCELLLTAVDKLQRGIPVMAPDRALALANKIEQAFAHIDDAEYWESH
jgi:hypothetical protein